MINETLKPIDKYVKIIDPTDKHGKLEMIISIYNEPKMMTENVYIFTTVFISELRGDEKWEYGNFLFEKPWTAKDVRKTFKKFVADPIKFKS